jgi:ABC-type polysaccharide/polyol phosphate export permease
VSAIDRRWTPARARLALDLAKREIRTRFAGSHLGILWVFFVPLLSSLVFVLIFSILMRGTMSGIYKGITFSELYFLGFAPWLFMSDVIARATTIVRENRSLIRNLQFDHGLLPISMCSSTTVAHLVVVALGVLLVVANGHRLNADMVVLPVYFVLLAIFSIGIAYFIAALSVYMTDLAQAVPIVLNLLFFTAPILYPPQLVIDGGGKWARFLLLELNPITRFVEGYRLAILDLGVPFDWSNLGLCAAWAAAALILGSATYRRLEKGFADVL